MDRRDLWLLLPEPLRRMPADLAAVAALTMLTILVVVVPVVNETPLRVPFGLVFVLFLPGYAFIAALFPEAGESPTEPDADDEAETSRLRDRGIDGIERIALSFGLSIAIVPLIGLVLNFTPWGIRLTPILLSVSGFTLACVAVATYRRWELPPEDRFKVPYRSWIESGRQEIFEPENRTDALLNVLLALSILLAVSSVAYAIMVPPDGEQFTEFYFLTEGADGELVAADYPTEFIAGEGQELIVGVGNQEHETVTYTVVIQLQDVEIVGNKSIVNERNELERLRTTVAHNESWHQTVTITPTMTGQDLRLQFLLYNETGPPATPTRENAYRDIHLWINVTEGGTAAHTPVIPVETKGRASTRIQADAVTIAGNGRSLPRADRV